MQQPFPFRLALIFLTLLSSQLVPATAAEDSRDFIWASQLGSDKGDDAMGMAVDQAGNIYVTGISGHKSSQSVGTHIWNSSGGEVFLAKFSPAGKLLWRQNAGGDGVDSGIAVAVDKMGSIFVTGYFSGKIKFGDVQFQATESKQTHKYTPSDLFVAKYSSDGKLSWVKQAGGPAMDQTYGVATDQHGNAYITGYFQGTAIFGSIKLESLTQPDGYHDPDTRYGDMFVAKYDPSGNVLWARQAGRVGMNIGHAIAVDSAANVYVTGRFEGNLITFNKIVITNSELCNFVAKYDSAGTVQWAQPTAGIGSLEFANNSIAVDGFNNVFVAGSFIFTQTIGGITLRELPGGNKDIFLVKYDADGKVLWCRQAGGEGHDTCEGVAVDQKGYAYLAGSFSEEATFGDIQIRPKKHDPRLSGFGDFVACYNPMGATVGVITLLDSANVKGIGVDPKGRVCLVGDFCYSVPFDATVLQSKKDFWGNQLGDVFVAKLYGK